VVAEFLLKVGGCPCGVLGHSACTPRIPSGILRAGTGRPQSVIQRSSPRPVLRGSPCRRPVPSPRRSPAAGLFSAPSARPSPGQRQASSAHTPCAQHDCAQSVNTGARLIRIAVPAMYRSPCVSRSCHRPVILTATAHRLSRTARSSRSAFRIHPYRDDSHVFVILADTHVDLFSPAAASVVLDNLFPRYRRVQSNSDLPIRSVYPRSS